MNANFFNIVDVEQISRKASNDDAPRKVDNTDNRRMADYKSLEEALLEKLSMYLDTTMNWKIDNVVSGYSGYVKRIEGEIEQFYRFRTAKRVELIKSSIVCVVSSFAVAFVLLVIADFLKAFIDMADTVVHAGGILK